jgi:BirA family biotin operon repressor/biotin-[acetyl-CoA-carboxylase] ligase
VSDRLLLERLQRGPATGVELAQAAGVTRGAIWERMQALRAAGIEISARPGRGYALAQPLELLDRERISALLTPAVQAMRPSLQLCFETASTQTLAASAPPEQGIAIWLAERQTAGQGRRGRTWVSPLAAHLSMSVARRFQRGFAALSGLSLVVGVAVAEALHALGYPQVRLKWPNDLWVDGRKLGGILIQLRGEAAGPCDAVIGLGINVRMPATFAARIDQPWCDLDALAHVVPTSRNALAAGVINTLLPALEQFERDGLTPFLPRWRALDALPGKPVRVLEGRDARDGIACGIDDQGALRVQHEDGERRYHGGEVSVRGVPAQPHRDGSKRPA